VIDDGVGMTPEQMRYFINHLAASSHEHGRRHKYGVVAKIATGSRNPHGLEYRSAGAGEKIARCGRRRSSLFQRPTPARWWRPRCR
jgi:hypothetical protein